VRLPMVIHTIRSLDLDLLERKRLSQGLASPLTDRVS